MSDMTFNSDYSARQLCKDLKSLKIAMRDE